MKNLIEGVIDEVITEPSKIQPIIVNFQNGELKDEEANKMTCGLYYDQKKQKTLIALSNGQVVYRGYKPDTKNDLTRTMLVFHNKRTGKIRLVQAERWQVGPVLQKPQIDTSNRDADDKVTQLNKQFGSKKMKRKTEQFERLKVNVDSLKEQLEQTVSNIEIDHLDLSTQVTKDEFVSNGSLPPCNRDATNVSNVYNIYDIVAENILKTLYGSAEAVLKGEVEKKSQFFEQTLKRMQSDPDKVKKVAILLYIEGVCSWLNMPIKNAKKRGIEVCSESAEVNSHIIETYSVTSPHGRLRPNTMRDKGVIHCMILALTIYNFELDLELFATILQNRAMGLKKLIALARVIGALPNKNDKNIISLKVPLPPQISAVRKGRKT